MARIVRILLISMVVQGLGRPVAEADDRPCADHCSAADAAYRRQLADLAQWCRAHGLDRQAARTAAWMPNRAAGQFCLFLAPPRQPPATPPVGAGSGWQEWHDRFLALRTARAAVLWRRARAAAEAGAVARALQWATEAVRENPNLGPARRALGYQQVDGRWCTEFAKRQLRRGYVWHDRFGWLKREDVRQYEAGRRRFGSRWIDAREDAGRRQSIRQGWRVRTDHYLVTTDASLEGGVQLAVKLEQLHQIWSQVFAGYLLAGKQRPAWQDSQPLLHASTRAHAIDYFASQAEYIAALRARQPKIGMTLGIYFDTTRRGYFFAGSQQAPGTLYHEATHQLFHETRRVARHVGRQANFWIIEGIATYMESLTEQNGYWTLGGFDAGRLPAARHRLLEDGYYLPLAQLVRLGVHQFQQRDDLRKLYSQVAGLATFLMHYDGGRYRNALIRYLVAVYTDRANADTLARLAGASYATLDRQYRTFLTAGDPRLTAGDPGTRP